MEKQMRAERERHEAILKTKEAEAQEIKLLKKAGADQVVLTLKSFEALINVANGQATKIIVPSDLQNIATLGTTIGEMFKDKKEEKMKESGLNYLKKIVKVLIWPIVFIVSQVFIVAGFTMNFNLKLNMDVEKLQEYVKTIEYQTALNKYLNDYKLLIMLISLIIFLPIFLKLYKKYKPKEKINLNVNDISLLSLLGISLFFIFNIILVILNHFLNIMEFNIFPFSLNLLISILCTGIIGPILEEYLFRGIVYNQLKTFENKTNSTVIASLIFALVHVNYLNMIYALLISFILIKIYERYKTLKAPIIVHIGANTSNLLFFKFIATNHLITNSLILIGMTIIFIYIFKKVINEK